MVPPLSLTTANGHSVASSETSAENTPHFNRYNGYWNGIAYSDKLSNGSKTSYVSSHSKSLLTRLCANGSLCVPW